MNTYCISDLCRPRARHTGNSQPPDAFLPLPVVELASTFLLLDAAAACRTAKTTLRLPAVVSAAAQAALLTVRMRARRAPGDPLIFHKTRVPSTAKEACARQFRRHNDERPSTSWTRDF